MWSAASVLACALSVLGRSESSMPRIELIDVAPIGISSSMPRIELIDVAPIGISVGAEAFIWPGTGTIYLITSTDVFQAALARRHCSDNTVMRKLASILAHEEWHIRHGADEKAAYEYQLITLIRLGEPPGTNLYRAVQVSMLHILKARKRAPPEQMLASR